MEYYGSTSHSSHRHCQGRSLSRSQISLLPSASIHIDYESTYLIFYSRNRDKIRIQMSDRYYRQLPPQRRNSADAPLAVQDTLALILTDVDKHEHAFDTLISSSSTSYAAGIYDRCYQTLQTEGSARAILDSSVKTLESSNAQVNRLLDKILQLDGMGPAYKKTENVVKRFV